MCDGIMARTFEHEKVTGLARYASVPVINGLTDYSHPCQAMTDVMTMEEHFGSIKGRTIAFIGDGNNVARSLSLACGRTGMNFVLACPKGYELQREEVDRIQSLSPEMSFVVTDDPIEAVRNADALYTDTWVSMGQEKEKAERLAAFKGFCIDERLLAAAPKHAIVLHCLPAYRGYEISDEAIEGKQSLVFQQAENRLHFQKGLLAVLMGGA
jgi:ornithine carbamoyltransferase